jgi:hypothetical protein
MSSRKKIVVAIIIAVLVLPIILVTIGFWPGSTREAEEIADQLQPGEQWQLISIDNQPPRIICLQGHCGELRKIWHGPPAIFKSCDDLLDLSRQLSENGQFHRNDEQKRNDDLGIMSYCDISAVVSDQNVKLSYDSFANDDFSTLILNIGGD